MNEYTKDYGKVGLTFETYAEGHAVEELTMVAYNGELYVSLVGTVMTSTMPASDWYRVTNFGELLEAIRKVKADADELLADITAIHAAAAAALEGMAGEINAKLNEIEGRADEIITRLNVTNTTVAEAERLRAEAETLRVTAEGARREAEQLRVIAETARDTEEQNRKTAETKRVAADNARKEEWAHLKTDINTTIETADAAAARAIAAVQGIDAAVARANTAAENAEQAAQTANTEAGKIVPAVAKMQQDVQHAIDEIPADAPKDGKTYGRKNGDWVEAADEELEEKLTALDHKVGDVSQLDEKVAAEDLVKAINKAAQLGGGGGDDTMLRKLAGVSNVFVYEDFEGNIHSKPGYLKSDSNISNADWQDVKKIWACGWDPNLTTQIGIVTSRWASNVPVEEIYPILTLPQKCTTFGGICYSAKKLKKIDVSGINLENITSFEVLNGCGFYNCAELEEIIGIENWATGNLTSCTLRSFIQGCSVLESDIDIRKIDSSTCGSIDYFATNSRKIKSIKLGDLSACTTAYQSFMLCEALEYLEIGNCQNIVWNTSFLSCYSLKNIVFTGNYPAHSMDLSYSRQLTHDCAVALLNGVPSVSGQVITFHADVKSQLSASEIAVATAKGWTIA